MLHFGKPDSHFIATSFVISGYLCDEDKFTVSLLHIVPGS